MGRGRVRPCHTNGQLPKTGPLGEAIQSRQSEGGIENCFFAAVAWRVGSEAPMPRYTVSSNQLSPMDGVLGLMSLYARAPDPWPLSIYTRWPPDGHGLLRSLQLSRESSCKQDQRDTAEDTIYNLGSRSVHLLADCTCSPTCSTPSPSPSLLTLHRVFCSLHALVRVDRTTKAHHLDCF
ncbi:hypothetical protein HDV57DRAFT_357752 [Trichoderma longibrachiatum]|uniref:Uncharacterized protein n=1 Tax=Trichoderma longibrachiatum ATCC 18648 TaxID=983965 RepID=A0A2T4BWT0_TRILO|nr:hypothetical protein M440DRAFT_120611 [Trichoderma longibrachiatum ATCC 18648]